MEDKDKEIIEELEEIVPKSMLSDEQFRVAEKMYWPDAVKYIHSETNCGLKFAKTYWDLYINDRNIE